MKLAILFSAVLLSGCSTISNLWPRAHDPVLVDRWVSVNIAVDAVNCDEKPTGWANVVTPADHLYQLAEFRSDPQSENLKGLWLHTQRMAQGGSRVFCELGKKTAKARLAAARSAWEGR